MSFVTGLIQKRLDPSRKGLAVLGLWGMQTAAGPAVTPQSSLRTSAVYACVRIISESIASLPMPVFRRQGRNKIKAIDHPLYRVLHDQANPEQTAMEFRELQLSHVLLWGNSYSEIEWNDAGQVAALWPLFPDKIRVQREADGQLWYYVHVPGVGDQPLPWWRVHHIRGLSGDGVVGYSPIRVAALQAVGLALAAEEYGARFYGNGARPGGVLEHPGKLSTEAQSRLRQAWGEDVGGLSNAHRVKVLEEGMKYHPISVPPNEAQFLETRKYQVTDIARIFRVPPHMLADLERATFSNIEHQGLEFVIHTLRPWLVRIEQAISRDLMTEDEKRTYYAKHNVEGLLRGDTQARYQAYDTAIRNGILSPNEARDLEDLNPRPGGDTYLQPLNMVATGGPATPRHRPVRLRVAEDYNAEYATRAEEVADDRRSTINRQVRLFEDAAGRLVKREVADIRRAIKRTLAKDDIGGFLTWLARFYEELREAAPDYFVKLMESLAETISAKIASEIDGEDEGLTDGLRDFIRQYLTNYASSYTVGSEKQLRAIIAEAGGDAAIATEAITERIDEWEERKAGKEGLAQAFEAANALSVFVYSTAGVAYLLWMASGSSCPYCQNMDGRRVPTGETFVEAGQTVDGGEDEEPLKVSRNVKHPPIHSGCDCLIVSG